MARKKNKPKAIDLFSGCGGLSLGLKQAGFSIVAAIDNDKVACSTYKLNHRQTELLEKDITKIRPEYLRRRLGIKKGDLDLLAGCPPCQGFSTLRTHNGSIALEEPMNDLVFQFTKFVRAFLPKSIMMENVPALATDSRITKFRREIARLGYKSSVQVRDAADFGTPQRRRRMILIAFKGETPVFAEPRRRRRTVSAAISHLSKPGKSGDPLHDYSVTRADHVMKLIKRIPRNGGSRTDLPATAQLRCHRKVDGFRDVYGRMAWNTQAPTITGGCINPSKGRFLHPSQNRAITLREAAMLQGFPSRYKFDLGFGRYPTAQAIGNAFPPKFAEHHAREIINFIQSVE